MTFDQRVLALQFLNLTQRQTRFVVTVALHGGYCLRRQYAAFAGIAYGAKVREFLDHLVTRGLMERLEYRRDRGFVYHLQAKSIYRALEQHDNRNRRQVSSAVVARKLMLLDFILMQSGAEWFATEQDKVALFTERFAVPKIDLPQRAYAAYAARVAPTTRYFVNKWPIYLVAGSACVHFVVLVVDSSGKGFLQFLMDHARLLAHLPAWTIEAISPAGQAGLPACQTVFEGELSDRHGALRQNQNDLRRFFRTRHAMESDDLASVSVADIDHFRKVRARLVSPAIEMLYPHWRANGDDVLQIGRAAEIVGLTLRGELKTHQLFYSYQQFGDLAGEC